MKKTVIFILSFLSINTYGAVFTFAQTIHNGQVQCEIKYDSYPNTFTRAVKATVNGKSYSLYQTSNFGPAQNFFSDLDAFVNTPSNYTGSDIVKLYGTNGKVVSLNPAVDTKGYIQFVNGICNR